MGALEGVCSPGDGMSMWGTERRTDGKMERGNEGTRERGKEGKRERERNGVTLSEAKGAYPQACPLVPLRVNAPRVRRSG